MSRVVDNRVVEMEFDNSNFERNVKTSLSTLDKLKAALSFKGADKSFNMVEAATSGVGKSFSFMGEIAIGALRKFGGAIEDWAAKTIKSLSGVENIAAGMDKFEKITKSSATLMAQGFSNKSVNRELKKLNWFTDETSYNLTDMVDNISKFTATGQGLKESSEAMMGIALWAATAGQTAGTASRAMYQLSQAMSGYMRKEDWKSIQNANMDMKEFRLAALEAGVAAGTLEKRADGMYRSLIAKSKSGGDWFKVEQFADYLTEGAWFTAPVMMDVYRKYTKAANDIYTYQQKHVGATVQDAIAALGDSLDEFSLKAFLAGQEARSWGDAVDSVKDALSTKWMGVFQHIFGSAKQATKFFTDLSYSFYDMFVEPMSGVVESFHKWRNAFGRKEWQNSLISTLDSVNTILNTVRETFDKFTFGDKAKEMIDWSKKIRKQNALLGVKKDTKGRDVLLVDRGEDGIIEARAQALLDLTHKFKDFSDRFAAFVEETDLFERLTKGVLAVFGLIWEAVTGLWTALKPFRDLVKDLLVRAVEKILDLSDAIYGLYRDVKKNKTFSKAFTSFLTPFVTLKNKLDEFTEKFVPRFKERWEEFTKNFSFLGDRAEDGKTKFKNFIDEIKSKWESLFTDWDVDKTINGIFNALSKLKELIYDIVGVKNDEEFGKWVEEKLGDISTSVGDFKTTVEKTAKDIWETIKEYSKKAKEWINQNWSGIASTAADIFRGIAGFFTGIWSGLKQVFSKDEAEDGTNALDDIIEAFKSFGEILGNLIGIISAALKPLGDKLKELFGELNLENGAGLLKAGGIAALGVGFYKLASGFKKSLWLSGFKDILGGIGETISGFTKVLDAKAIKDVAISIGIIVAAILLLISIPVDKLLSAAGTLGLVITVIAKALKNLAGYSTSVKLDKNGLNASKNGVGSTLLMTAFSLLAIAGVLVLLAKVPKEDLYRAVTVLVVIMAFLTLMLKVIGNITSGDYSKQTIKKSNISSGNASGNTLIKTGGPAATIFAFALFIGAVLLAVKMFMDMIKTDEHRFWKAVAVVGGIAVVLGVFLGVLGSIYKETCDSSGKIKSPSKELWKTIVAVAAGIYIVALAMAKLMEVSTDNTELGLVSGFILLFLGGIVALAAFSKNADFKNFNKLALGMIVISLAISLILGAMYLLASSKGNVDSAIGAVAILGLVMFALSALGKSFKTAKSVDRFMKYAEAMVVLSAAILVVAGAMYALAQIPAEDYVSVLIGLALGLGALLALGWIGTKFGVGLEMAAKAIMFIGIAVAAVGAGFLMAAEAIKIFASNTLDVKKAADNISLFMDTIVTKIGKWVTEILTAILTTFLASFPAMVTALIDTANSTLENLVAKDSSGRMKIETMTENLLKVINAVLTGLKKYAPDIVSAAGDLILALVDELNTWLINNADIIGRILCDGLKVGLEAAFALVDNLGEMIFGEKGWESVRGVLETAKEWLENNFFTWLWDRVIGSYNIVDELLTKGADILGVDNKVVEYSKRRKDWYNYYRETFPNERNWKIWQLAATAATNGYYMSDMGAAGVYVYRLPEEDSDGNIVRKHYDEVYAIDSWTEAMRDALNSGILTDAFSISAGAGVDYGLQHGERIPGEAGSIELVVSDATMSAFSGEVARRMVQYKPGVLESMDIGDGILGNVSGMGAMLANYRGGGASIDTSGLTGHEYYEAIAGTFSASERSAAALEELVDKPTGNTINFTQNVTTKEMDETELYRVTKSVLGQFVRENAFHGFGKRARRSDESSLLY